MHSGTSFPLAAYQDFSSFKLYLLDTGLLCAMAKLDSSSILEGNELLVEFKRSLTEQFVLSELKSSENLQAKSLKSFIDKYDTKINVRTSLSDYRKEEKLINIPLYIIGNIKEILM